ncbi:protein PLASTID MOVEMENT IMPAIRED 1 [Rosa rugosa]|uniref:protein PLASTID MOVEMENT IMPAIRED 1 n=1 Tax=Rosa rugosa TaxID=74645 RepID=UPI002B41861C|nr:protein PLASTID MOVEMENT IMPAIRED 1 [Rosa rugosa]
MAAAENSSGGGRRNSNTQLLEELEALSESLYQSHTSTTTTRRTASLALPRSSNPAIPSRDEIAAAAKVEEIKANSTKPLRRRLSLSPWRSRPNENEHKDRGKGTSSINQLELKSNVEERSSSKEKKGIWNWKPIRAISHIGMHKISCLFSVEVVSAQGLPASMNGLRLSICVRKKESKDGAVQTMPSRVTQGAADFEETLFFRCHVYCSSGQGKPMKFEPRPFWIYVFAVDAEELDFGRNSVDLSQLIQESIEKSHEGKRIRQWDKSFRLSGKAKGGELVLKLGFQIMEKDGGVGIYSTSQASRTFSSSFARKQSKTSFSVPSPKLSSREAWTPSQIGQSAHDLHGIDELNLDEPNPVPVSSSSSAQKPKEPEALKVEDLDLPDFEVVDKGVEFQDKEGEYGEAQSEISLDEKSAISSEVVKEIVQDQVHMKRLTELDSIAQQIKALESMMGKEKTVAKDEEIGSQILEADEETVTKEFLQMLEDEDIINEYKLTQSDIPPLQLEGAEDSTEAESAVFLPDLGKSLGCVVQTRDGGYLAAMNPLDTVVARKDTPKLAMQISKPFVLPWDQSMSGFELFQRIAAIGLDELNSQISTLTSMDDLMDKTAEQIAFEGIASAIIQGRNKEGASSSAARTIAAVKTMATAMSAGRKERISTGIWNVNENPLTAEEILAFSMQKIESMALEALKIQAEMAEEEAPFDVSPLIGTTATGGKVQNQPLASSISLEDWIKDHSLVGVDDLLQPGGGHTETITLAVVVQLRDPVRRYEAVGGPMIAVIYATRADNTGAVDKNEEEEKRFKVASLHVGGLRVRSKGVRRNAWDSEKQRLTAMQWLVAYGFAKAGKKGKHSVSSKGQDLLWSISSRVMGDMWLKYMRNPDVKFTN